MKWIVDYWYLIVIGLAAAVYFFGCKSKGDGEETNDTQIEEHHGEKSHKNGHSCCH